MSGAWRKRLDINLWRQRTGNRRWGGAGGVEMERVVCGSNQRRATKNSASGDHEGYSVVVPSKKKRQDFKMLIKNGQRISRRPFPSQIHLFELQRGGKGGGSGRNRKVGDESS